MKWKMSFAKNPVGCTEMYLQEQNKEIHQCLEYLPSEIVHSGTCPQ